MAETLGGNRKAALAAKGAAGGRYLRPWRPFSWGKEGEAPGEQEPQHHPPHPTPALKGSEPSLGRGDILCKPRDGYKPKKVNYFCSGPVGQNLFKFCTRPFTQG